MSKEKTFSQIVKDEIKARLNKKNKPVPKDMEAVLKLNEKEKRNLICEMFIEKGSITDPEKSYHLEFVCDNKFDVEKIVYLLHEFEISPKIISRGKNSVLYVKDSSAIVEFLGIVGASVSLMNMENSRILKEVRGSINRRVNCETANIAKTANAASRQIKDIEYLRDNYGFDKLEDKLSEMANVRLQNPDVSLSDLGKLLDPPIGKSGVNHRLRKLCAIADDVRVKKGDA